MQSWSATLHFAFSIVHLGSPRSSVRSERHRAKVEVAGAIPAVDAIFSALRTRHSAVKNGDHDVIAASRPVKAFVPVRIRLVTPISMGRR
jgi:hypothetical protein